MQKKTQRPGLNHQAGQVGIIVLLISAIILVIALSIANRVVRESQGNIAAENSTRVFNTAESGVQQALANIFQYESNQVDSLNSNFSFEDANLNQVRIDTLQNFEAFLPEGQATTINIVNGQTGTITLHWSKSTCDQGAANLLIGHYYRGQTATATLVRYYLVGNCPSFSDQNLIRASNPTLSGYKFRYSLPITGGTLGPSYNQNAFLRIIPIERGTNLHVAGSPGLISGAQYTILSLAQMPDGSSAKAIEVTKSMPSAPAFMDFALVSGGYLSKAEYREI